MKKNDEIRDLLSNEVLIIETKEDKKGLQQLILQLADQKIEDRFSDRNLDRENEKIKLRGGKEITVAEVKKLIAESVEPYYPIFTNETEFYSEIYRLNRWPQDEAKQYHKRSQVGKFTNEIIYSRFSNEILPVLQHLNPYVGNSWTREFKHFQWLTIDAKGKVESFIKEAVKIMKGCDTWYEFRVKYFIEYNVPFQSDAFENTNKMISDYISSH